MFVGIRKTIIGFVVILSLLMLDIIYELDAVKKNAIVKNIDPPTRKEKKMQTLTGIDLEVGVKWKCKHCDHRLEYVDGQEWQFHCNDTMSMIPFYKLHPVILEAEKGKEDDRQ